jgi:hypothetical protein
MGLFGSSYQERKELGIIEMLVGIVDRLTPRQHKHKVISLFTFQFLNYKFTSTMDAVLSVPSGTPVTGFNAAGDAKGNDLGDSRYLAGSCVYAVIGGPSGNPPGFTVAPGSREEAFVVTETTPGSASDGIIIFNAKDSAGNVIPQSQGILTFTAAPAVVTQNLFTFDQTSH